MRRIVVIHRTPRANPVLAVLDRLIGDALVAAMLILGFVFCLGAARAAEPSHPADSQHFPRACMDPQR